MSKKRKAIVLLSGGIDSSTTLYLAKKKGYRCHCLIFDYGQRHDKEVEVASKVAWWAGCTSTRLSIKLPWKGSSLVDKRQALPRGKVRRSGQIPSTYVPARNTIFLSFALSCAEAMGADVIFIGANAIDYSGYPDCRPRYYKAFRQLSGVATRRGVEGNSIKIATPLIRKTKANIIKMGIELKVPYKLTWSCYRGGKRPCGKCDSCVIREKGFKKAGFIDPLIGE